MIIHRIKKYVKNSSISFKVKAVRIGLGYTAVSLESGATGVTYTFSPHSSPGCSLFKGKRPLSGKRASELLAYLGSKDRIESALGLATVNALVNTKSEKTVSGDILKFLTIQPGEKMVMVGYFAPLIQPLKEKGVNLTVFDEKENRDLGILPYQKSSQYLQTCNTALISSTSIINHTIDPLLDCVQNCPQVILLGASTPLIPQIFEDTPVDYLAGILVTHPQEVLKVVSEAGGMGFFKPYVQKVRVRVE